jgi:cyanate permease
LLIGPTVFGLLLVAADSYRAAWAAVAVIATLVTLIALLGGPAIDRESARPG